VELEQPPPISKELHVQEVDGINGRIVLMNQKIRAAQSPRIQKVAAFNESYAGKRQPKEPLGSNNGSQDGTIINGNAALFNQESCAAQPPRMQEVATFNASNAEIHLPRIEIQFGQHVACAQFQEADSPSCHATDSDPKLDSWTLEPSNATSATNSPILDKASNSLGHWRDGLQLTNLVNVNNQGMSNLYSSYNMVNLLLSSSSLINYPPGKLPDYPTGTPISPTPPNPTSTSPSKNPDTNQAAHHHPPITNQHPPINIQQNQHPFTINQSAPLTINQHQLTNQNPPINIQQNQLPFTINQSTPPTINQRPLTNQNPPINGQHPPTIIQHPPATANPSTTLPPITQTTMSHLTDPHRSSPNTSRL